MFVHVLAMFPLIFFLLIGYPKLQQSQGRGVVQRGFPFGKET